ncbi:MAG: glycine cleavage system protein GcvH [Limnohabitans sp.]|nr:glycine cleavage system protein GcvH [Limnohabitans sp.]
MTRYHEEHTWIRIEGDIAFAGITVHAQDTLGDIVFVELAQIGKSFAQGSTTGVVESVKAAADVHMPVSATVLEVNEELRADPSLANSDPEGAGWFYQLKLSRPAEMDGLMDEAAYLAFCGN